MNQKNWGEESSEADRSYQTGRSLSQLVLDEGIESILSEHLNIKFLIEGNTGYIDYIESNGRIRIAKLDLEKMEVIYKYSEQTILVPGIVAAYIQGVLDHRGYNPPRE